MIWHYAQIMRHDGVFAEYSSDYHIPGKRIPLENIDKMPTYLFCGLSDPVASCPD